MLKKILKYKLLILFIILLSFGSIHLITAYLFSSDTEKILNDQFKKLTDSQLIEVVNYKYNKGIFISSSEVELKINNKLLQLLNTIPTKNKVTKDSYNFHIKYHNYIKSGIFAGILSGYFTPTLSIVKTNIEFESNLNRTLNKFFNNKQPLIITNIIKLDHSGKFIITSPAFNYEEELSKVNLNWGGLLFNIEYDKNFNNFIKNLALPYIKFNIPTKFNIDLKSLNYNSNRILSENKISIGNNKLKLNNLSLHTESGILSNINLTNILTSLTGIKINDFIQEFNLSNTYDLTITNLNYITNSSDLNNYFSSHAIINIESIIFNKYFLGPLNIDFETSHINAKSFNDLITLFDNKKLNNIENHENFIESLKNKFIPILIESPVIKLNNFNLVTNKGNIYINGFITTKGFESIDITSQDLFFKKIYFTTNFSIPKDVFNYLLMMQIKYFLNFGNAEVDDQSYQSLSEVISILLDNQIKKWKKNKYIKESNGIISSYIILDQNHLIVTDK
jgi:uncharacterized protein YdgA (DUF945 family)